MPWVRMEVKFQFSSFGASVSSDGNIGCLRMGAIVHAQTWAGLLFIWLCCLIIEEEPQSPRWVLHSHHSVGSLRGKEEKRMS